MLLRTLNSGHPQGTAAAQAAAATAAKPAAATDSQPPDVLEASGEDPPSAATEAAAQQTPYEAAEESAQQSAEVAVEQPPVDPHLMGPGSIAASMSEDDVVPELPDYEDSEGDDVEGTEEEEDVISQHQSEPVSPARPYRASQSAPVTPAKSSSKKGWSFKRMFGSKKRKGAVGEGIEDDGGNALPAARSISAGDLGGSLTSPRKKKGGRLARLLGRKRQVRVDLFDGLWLALNDIS